MRYDKVMDAFKCACNYSSVKSYSRFLCNLIDFYVMPIRAVATATLRRLALSVLFTIATNSYQTTCTVSERTFNKRQHANARYRVGLSLFTHYDMVAVRT